MGGGEGYPYDVYFNKNLTILRHSGKMVVDMQNNVPAPPPVINANTNPFQNTQPQYSSEIEMKYNILAQEIAKNAGIKINGKINVDVLANSMGDFFEKKQALETSSKSFEELAKSWERVYSETDPDPLRLAMGGSLFSNSGDDTIKVKTEGLNEGVKREFFSILNDINAKPEVVGQHPNEVIKARRDEIMKAAIIYRLRHPVCSTEDSRLYNNILNGVNEKDQSIAGKNTAFSTISTVLSIGSTIGSTLIGFGVISCPAVTIALMAVTALMLIPRIISLCRSLTKLGYNDEAKKIRNSFALFDKNIQGDGKINITTLMRNHYDSKERCSVELGQKYLNSINASAQQREKLTGIVAPAKLNNQQQKAMNNVYNGNYPMKPVQQGNVGYSLDGYNKARCKCNNVRG